MVMVDFGSRVASRASNQAGIGNPETVIIASHNRHKVSPSELVSLAFTTTTLEEDINSGRR